jgi:predicted RNase H-like nuclease (RuvC/YqgF family)
MKKRVQTDEYGLELTKEEQEEADRIARSAWDAITKPQIKKKGGWPKGKPRKPVGEEMEEKKEIAPAQLVVKANITEKQAEELRQKMLENPPQIMKAPNEVMVPIAVKEALEEKLEALDQEIRTFQKDIDEKKSQISKLEQRYKVIADYITKGN